MMDSFDALTTTSPALVISASLMKAVTLEGISLPKTEVKNPVPNLFRSFASLDGALSCVKLFAASLKSVPCRERVSEDAPVN